MAKLLIWPTVLALSLISPATARGGPKKARKTRKNLPTVSLKTWKEVSKALRRWRVRLRRKLRTCDPGARGGRATFTLHIPPKGSVTTTFKAGTKPLQRCLRNALKRSPPPRSKRTVRAFIAARWLDHATRRRQRVMAKLRKRGILAVLGKGGMSTKLFGSGRGFKGGTIGGLIGSSKGVRIGGLGIRGRGRGGGGTASGSVGIAGKIYRNPKLRARRRKQVDKKRKRLLAKALKLPRARGSRAPWLRPAPKTYTPFNSPSHDTRAVGAKLAVVKLNFKQLVKPGKFDRWKRRHHHIIVDAQRGYRGVIRFPKDLTPTWIGLDVDNRIYVADRRDQLYRAGSPADALAGRFQPVAKLDKVLKWHAAGKVLLAVSHEKLLRSTDQGKTFAVLPHPKDTEHVYESALRADGLVAIITSHHGKRTLFTKLGTSPWTRTSFQPHHLWQAANTIYARNACGYALLARDGKTWFKGSVPSSRGWARSLAPQRITRRRVFKGPSQLVPAPEAVAGNVIASKEPALCRMGRGGGGMGLGGNHGPTATGCRRGMSQPARCLRGSALRGPLASVYAFYPIGDKNKSLLFVDHLKGALRATALPKGCALPQRLVPLPGAMMLHCDDGVTRTKVYIAGKQGIWHDQGVLASPARELRQVQIAEDGTLVLQACDFNKKRERAEGNGYLCSTAWIRRPVALKLGAKAWREVQQRDMLAYRALSGGKVLAIDRGDERGRTLRLFVDDGKRRRTLGRAIKLDKAGNLSNLLFEDGRIFFRRRYGSKLILLRKGELAPWPKLP